MLIESLTSQPRSIYFLLNWSNTIHIATKTNKKQTKPPQNQMKKNLRPNSFRCDPPGGSLQQFLSSVTASYNFTESVAMLIEILLHFAALLRLSLLILPYNSAVQQQK